MKSLCSASLGLFLFAAAHAAPPPPPVDLQAAYGANPDFPATHTGRPDAVLTWRAPAAPVTGWKLNRRAWGETKWRTIQLSDPAATRYVDTDALAGSPSVTYHLSALGPEGASPVATVTAWRLERRYPATPTWSWPGTEVWICNAPGKSPALTRHGESRLALKKLGEWPQLSAQVDGIVLFYSTIQSASVAELREFARALAPTPTRGRIRLAIEIGVFHSSARLDDPAAQQDAGVTSFAAQQRVLRRFTDPVSAGGAGGVIDFLYLDGPLHRAMFHQGKRTGLTMADAAEQVVRWMERWRAEYPALQFQLIANFSSWSFAGVPARNSRPHAEGAKGFGAYEDVLATLPPLAAQRGVPLTGVITDFAYDAFTNEAATDQPDLVRGRDYRARFRALHDQVTALPFGPGGAPLKFGMLANSNRGTGSSNYAARVELLNYLEEIHALGLQPAQIVVETWNAYPDRWLPESRPDTMTHLTWRVLNRLRHGRDVASDSAP